MRSVVAFTYEIDDIAKASEELAKKILTAPSLPSHRIGVLFCDSEAEHRPLVALLRLKLSMEIVGCTTVALLGGAQGYHEMAIGLMVLASEDANFAAVLSEPLSADDAKEQIERAYKKGKALLGETPKLIFALPAQDFSILLDDYVETLDAVSGGVPVVGGLTGWAPPYGASRVFAEGNAYSDRMVLVLISGIRPVFAVRNVYNTVMDQKRRVTSSEGGTIYTVGDVSGNSTFVDFLRSLGLPVEKMSADLNVVPFVAHPILLDMDQRDDYDGVPVLRTIHSINMETGCGVSIGRVPQGAALSLGSMKQRDVELSSRDAIRDLVQKMQENTQGGYAYSAILCVSCLGRHILMANNRGLEGRILAENVPSEINLLGFYGYGEFCPTSVRSLPKVNSLSKDGYRTVNRAHNESIVLCAF